MHFHQLICWTQEWVSESGRPTARLIYAGAQITLIVADMLVRDPLMTAFPRTLKKVCLETCLYCSLHLTLTSFALDTQILRLAGFFPKQNQTD